MSERYSVGARVQVKNNGQGSSFRKEGEYVGKFEGVVIAVNGPDYTGIPEVCVQSETGARRVILVGDLEEIPVVRPVMTRIHLTPKMVEALENTIEINGRQAMIMSHPKSQAALVPRGLADEHGYLTDQGRFVARLLSVGTKKRAWSWEELEAATRTWLRDRAKDAGLTMSKSAPADIPVPGTLVDPFTWLRRAGTEASEEVTKPTPEPVIEYSVKIWYRSGAYEGVAHSPEQLARQIFADAVKSAGVEFAELHGPSGKLVESKAPHGLTQAP